MDPFNSRFILKEKRWLWIDYDKGISIILVGYGHCFGILRDHGISFEHYPFFNYIGIFLYGFRMPLFFIVSGMLIAKSLNKRGLASYIENRANNILYPLIIWGCIQITLQIVLSGLTGNQVTPKTYLNLFISPRDTGHFWYLNALFCIGVIYALLNVKLKFNTIAQVILGFSMFCFSAYVHVNQIHFKLDFITDVCQFYIFFALGDLISKTMLNENFVKRFSSWKVFLPMFAVFLVIQYYFTQINIRPSEEGMNYVEHKMPFFYLFEALFGCATSFALSFMLQKHRYFTFLRVVGFHSLFIYCMQIIVMVIGRYIFINFLHINNVPALMLLIWSSGVILPVFIYNLCLRYGLWWLFTYKKPAREVEYLQSHNIFSLKKQKQLEGPVL